MARCLLIESNLPKSLWTYAVKTSAYIRNRCYCPRTEKTPYELFTGNRPNISNMEELGSKCFAYVQDKRKLDARSKEAIFVGYDSTSPANLVYFPTENAIRRVRCVTFVKSDQAELKTCESLQTRIEPTAQVTNDGIDI